MKRFFVLFFIVAIQPAGAQPGLKLYGYSQAFTPGMLPQRRIPSENGSVPIEKPASGISYYIYIAVTRNISLQPKEIWIRDHWFAVKRSQVVQTPVLANYPPDKILVPATTLKVWGLEKEDLPVAAQRFTPALKKLMKEAELIVAYTWKGKMYYASLKKFIVLPPFHAQ